MSFDYSRLNDTATTLIKRFGQTVTFNRYTETYQISSPTSISSSSFSADVVLMNKPVTEEDTAQEMTTHTGLAQSTTAIEVGDVASINSENMRVVGVTKVQPSTKVLYYELQFAS
jgi:hypothetical protein